MIRAGSLFSVRQVGRIRVMPASANSVSKAGRSILVHQDLLSRADLGRLGIKVPEQDRAFIGFCTGQRKAHR